MSKTKYQQEKIGWIVVAGTVSGAVHGAGRAIQRLKADPAGATGS